ncbi:Armadillo-like helical domain-containing protein 3 [Psilocybe cubensis]|uniref:Armadillo-like helical domain-containing protein 3 n=2 Tax=Psilocybe cubensis TaxID=181762 RepID=A0ACB8HFS3_PSICU|nr:Armadillo-like helical domain-containing protein 3 [Psilocybe cubensis]KAH9486507.1 Armadillo-like helical domain-containing protein 3 [Psilocybe cubensis]
MLLGHKSNSPRGLAVTSKFVAIYSKLFQGLSPQSINPEHDQERLFSDLLDLKVDRSYLREELDKIPKEKCTGTFKPLLSTLFRICIKHARSIKNDDDKRLHAMETQSILVSTMLAKNLTGWEVMEILAGSVSQSDFVFSEFTETLDVLIGDSGASVTLRHQAVQLGLIFMCGVGQLSTGAYFLRRNFFPSIVSFVKSPEMEQYVFEAVLFLAILANYHKSDAAKLNTYLKQIRNSSDGDFMRKLCWVSNYTLGTSIKQYQELGSESFGLNLTSSFGAVLNRWLPENTLLLSHPNAYGDKYKDQPVEATVILLAVYEFLLSNPMFATVLIEDMVSPDDSVQCPLFCTIISLTSYLCTHAMSTASPRSIAYAGISINMILALVENKVVMEFISQNNVPSIQMCRQRSPPLPASKGVLKPPVCFVLDCCILWLRHNLHKRLEVPSFINVVWICYRVIWFLQHRRVRLDYYWTELWNSLFNLLDFLSSKLESLHTTGGVEMLISETLCLLDLAVCTSESFLPTPRLLHEFIYELVRSSSILKKQEAVIRTLAIPDSSTTRPSLRGDSIVTTLEHILSISSIFEAKIGSANIGNAKDTMKAVAAEIEANGLHVTREILETVPPTRSQEVLDFARIACEDGLALMP